MKNFFVLFLALCLCLSFATSAFAHSVDEHVSISRDGYDSKCYKCGGSLEMTGVYYEDGIKFGKFRCYDCGHKFRMQL